MLKQAYPLEEWIHAGGREAPDILVHLRVIAENGDAKKLSKKALIEVKRSSLNIETLATQSSNCANT